MSLLLCRQEDVTSPYYVEDLGISLYSSQELSYVVYQYPLLVMDGFVGERLLEFLRDQLNQGFLALKLERWIKSGGEPDETLIMILQECDYYSPTEISAYRQKVAGLRKKHPAEYGKMKADMLFSMRQYARAAARYQELLELPDDAVSDERFRGCVLNDLGACYARMFQTGRAFEAFEGAYARLPDEKVLKHLYFLTKIDPALTLGDRLKAMVTGELAEKWDGEIQSAREAAEQSEQVAGLKRLFGRDPIKRQAGEAGLLKRWKQEYRAMMR